MTKLRKEFRELLNEDKVDKMPRSFRLDPILYEKFAEKCKKQKVRPSKVMEVLMKFYLQNG